MKKTVLILLIILLNLNLSFSQTESEIDSLLNGILKTENSKEITKTEQAKKVIAFGENSLLTLTRFFTDSTLTKVKSECQDRNLAKGEIAIILADQIEKMPYFPLTGVQNCTMEFCKNNPNLIEYYLEHIKDDKLEQFKNEYVKWLYSKARLDYPIKLKGKARKERKRMINERKVN